TVYVLTQGEEFVILATDVHTRYAADDLCACLEYTRVLFPTTLDLGLIEFGVTTASDINALLNQGGGAICASLDMTGAPITVEVRSEERRVGKECSAGTGRYVENMATVRANPDEEAVEHASLQ